VCGATLPASKQLIFALPPLYGIGVATARAIVASLGLAPRIRVGDLTVGQQQELTRLLKEEYKIEAALRDEVKANVQALAANGSTRGFRHMNGLPSRGQRTRTNARSARKFNVGGLKREYSTGGGRAGELR
jgi:small subunit ribosomal protein S13